MRPRPSIFAAVVVGTLLVAACGSGGPPAIEDPKEILTKSVQALQSVKTVHLRGDASGSVKLAIQQGAPAIEFKLDGTSLEGDIDLAGKKLQLKASVPAFLGLTAEFIVADGSTYSRTSLGGSKWDKANASSSGTPTDPQSIIDEVNKFLSRPEVTTRKLADEKCGDQDCYHVTVTVPASEISGTLPSAAPLPSGITDLTVHVWVRRADLRPARLSTSLVIPDVGSIDISIALDKYDAVVSITAPPADQIK